MGYIPKNHTLTPPSTLEWPRAAAYSRAIRDAGIRQFIALWNVFKTRSSDVFFWGDEVKNEASIQSYSPGAMCVGRVHDCRVG